MGVDYQVRMIYNATITDITTSQDKWRNVLRLAGQLYRYEFDNIVMVYLIRPQTEKESLMFIYRQDRKL